MATNAPQDDWHKTGLRLPKELHHQLHEAAATSGRSYNAEIVARLQSSLVSTTGMPFAIEQAIEHEQEERGGTREEALTRLVLAGQAQGGTVFHVVVPRAMTMQEFRELMQASEKIIPPDANMILERR